MKKLLGLVFALIFSAVGLMGQAKDAQATKSLTRSEAVVACKAEGKIGKELSGCVKEKTVKQSEDEVETPEEEPVYEGDS